MEMRPQLRKEDPDEDPSPGPSRLTNGRPPPLEKKVEWQDQEIKDEEEEIVTLNVEDHEITEEPLSGEDIVTVNVQDYVIKNEEPPSDDDMFETENVQDINDEPESDADMEGFATEENVQDIQDEQDSDSEELNGLDFCPCASLLTGLPVPAMPQLTRIQPKLNPPPLIQLGSQESQESAGGPKEDEAYDSDESEYSEYASTTGSAAGFHPDSVVVELGHQDIKISLDKVPAKSVLRPRSRDHFTLPENFFKLAEYKEKLRKRPSFDDLARDMKIYRKKKRDSAPEPSASNIDTELKDDNEADAKNRRRGSLEMNASQEGEDDRNGNRRVSLPEPSDGNCHKKRVTWVEDPALEEVFMIKPLKNCVYVHRRTRASESEAETMQPRPPPPPLKRCASVDEIFVKRRRVCCEHTKRERAAFRRQWQAATWLQQTVHPEPYKEEGMHWEQQLQHDIGEASAHPEQCEVEMPLVQQLQPDIGEASAHPEQCEVEMPLEQQLQPDIGEASAHPEHYEVEMPLEQELQPDIGEASAHPEDEQLEIAEAPAHPSNEKPVVLEMTSKPTGSMSPADKINATSSIPSSTREDEMKSKKTQEAKGPTDKIKSKSPTPKELPGLISLTKIKAKSPKPQEREDEMKSKKTQEAKGPTDKIKSKYPTHKELPGLISLTKIKAKSPEPSAKPVDPPKKSHDCSKHRGRDHVSSKHSCSHGHGSHHKSHSKSSSSSTSRPDKDSKASCSRHSSHSSHHKSHSGSRHCSKHGHHARSYHVRTQVDPADLAASFMDSLSEEAKAKRSQQQTPRVPWSPHLATAKLKYGQFFRIVKCPNGGATTCHVYKDEIAHLDDAAQRELAKEFISLSFSEDADGNAHHVLGVVHGGAEGLPCMVEHFADHYGHLPVKVGSLKGPGTESSTMAEFRNGVYKTYSNGTFRYGYLQEVSLCGIRGEECGGYFPDFIRLLELNPFLVDIMPWGSLSALDASSPLLSNDGPIFWVRPGEQTIPSTGSARARSNKGASRFSEERAKLFEDRTKPHGDHSGSYEDTGIEPVCAVGVLKAVTCGNKEHEHRDTKDVICFSAKEYNRLQDVMQIDVFDPPQSQCTQWLDIGKLNMINRLGIPFAHLKLESNCIYLIPRKVIHQFQTISAVSSIAWHARYHEHSKSVNLVQGVPPNKGVVYNEKTDVPKYKPPMPDETDENEEETFAKSTPRKKYRRRSEGEPKTDEKKAKKTPVKSNTPLKQMKPATESLKPGSLTSAKSHTPMKQMKPATESLKPESLTSAKSHTQTKPPKPIGESLKPTAPAELSGAVTTNGDKTSSGAKKPDGKKPSAAAGAPEKKTDDKTEPGKPPLKRPGDAPNDMRKIKKKKENPDVVSSILAMMDKKKEF